MKSMTGYGYEERCVDTCRVAVEIKSYNNRYLDISVGLPPALSRLEPRVREFMSSRVARGRVEISIDLEELESELHVSLDKTAAVAFVDAGRQLAEALGVSYELDMARLLSIDGLVKTERNLDADFYWDPCREALSRSFDQFDRARAVEGASTEHEIQHNVASIRAEIDSIEARSPQLEQQLRADLTSKVGDFLGSDLDDDRVVSALALLLVKHDVSEEIARIRSHVDSFRDILLDSQAMGKRLEFVCQEMLREINTIGSKCGKYDIDVSVIQVKDAIEKIREQLRNVE